MLHDFGLWEETHTYMGRTYEPQEPTTFLLLIKLWKKDTEQCKAVCAFATNITRNFEQWWRSRAELEVEEKFCYRMFLDVT